MIDLPSCKQLPQPRIKASAACARDGIVGRDGAALFDHLTGRVQTNDSLKSRAGEVLADLPHFLFLLADDGQSTHNCLLRQRHRHSARGAAAVIAPDRRGMLTQMVALITWAPASYWMLLRSN